MSIINKTALLAITLAITFTTMNIMVYALEPEMEASDGGNGFYTTNEYLQNQPLSALSAEKLADIGGSIDLSTLAPVYNLRDAELCSYDFTPLAEAELQEQTYHALLCDSSGNPSGYALLQYDYYKPESEYILARAAEDQGFMAYYNEKVANRLEITEMGALQDASFDYNQNLDEITHLQADTKLDTSKTKASLINLTESMGYGILLTDTDSAYLILLDTTRMRELLGLSDTKIIEVSELAVKLQDSQKAAEQAELNIDGYEYSSEPVIGGYENVTAGKNAPSLHLIAICEAGLLLGAAGILFYSKIKKL